MTNERAVEILKTICGDCKLFPKCAYKKSECFTALDMAIEALQVGHAQCNDCHYRYHWMTQRMNGQNGGATA